MLYKKERCPNCKGILSIKGVATNPKTQERVQILTCVKCKKNWRENPEAKRCVMKCPVHKKRCLAQSKHIGVHQCAYGCIGGNDDGYTQDGKRFGGFKKAVKGYSSTDEEKDYEIYQETMNKYLEKHKTNPASPHMQQLALSQFGKAFETLSLPQQDVLVDYLLKEKMAGMSFSPNNPKTTVYPKDDDLHCSHCDAWVDGCEACGQKFHKDDTIWCEDEKHYCVGCAKDVKDADMKSNPPQHNTYEDYKEAVEGEGWAIGDYADMITKAKTEKERKILSHIRDEEKEHLDELQELMKEMKI